MTAHDGTGELPALGGDDAILRCDSAEEVDRVVLALLTQARRSIAVSAPVLDLPAFNAERTARALARFAADNRRNHARVLIDNEQDLMRRNPRLVELCRSLPSFIELRVLPQEYGPLEELVVVADGTGFLRRREPGGTDASASMNAPARCRQLLREFDHRWERGERPRELTVTGLK